MSNRYESGFVKPPGEDYSAIHHEIERLLVDVMRVYGNEFELGGNTSWYAEDESGDSYDLEELHSKRDGIITYTITRTDIQGVHTELESLQWSAARKLYVPQQYKNKGSITSNYERHAASQKIMIDNYKALQTANLPIRPYVRLGSNETVDIHSEFESMVAHAVDHRSYEHPSDNHHPVPYLRFAHWLDKGMEKRDWRVSTGTLQRASSDTDEGRA